MQREADERSGTDPSDHARAPRPTAASDAARAGERDRSPARRSGVAASRTRAIATEKRANASAATPAPAPTDSVEVDGAPVGGRALGEEAAEREHGQRRGAAAAAGRSRTAPPAGRRPPAGAARREARRPAPPTSEPRRRETARAGRRPPRPRARRPPAPASPPKLQPAWKDERIGVRSAARPRAPCAFIATSSSAAAAPNSEQRDARARARFGASARNGRISANDRARPERPSVRLPLARDDASRRAAARAASPSVAAEEREPELRLAEPEVVLDRRDARDPRPEDGAVGEEGER